MHYCPKCKELHDSECIYEWQEIDTGYIHHKCPRCGGDLIEAERCKICGEWIIPGKGYCAECVDEVVETMRWLQKSLRTDKTTFFDMIDKYLEGKL